MQEITLPQTNNSNRSDNAPKDQSNKPRKISVISQDDTTSSVQQHGDPLTDQPQNNNSLKNQPNNNNVQKDDNSQTDQSQNTNNNVQQGDDSTNRSVKNDLQSEDSTQQTIQNDFVDTGRNSASHQSSKIKSPSTDNFDTDDSSDDDGDDFGFPSNLSKKKRGNRSPFGDFSDPWGTDPFANDDQPGSKGGSKKLSPKERVKMIEEIYQQVLGRDPDTRDINYYKYSTLGPDEIRSQLMEGKEHQQLLNDGREYKKMKERAESAEVRVKALESQIKDQVEEFKYLSDLLKQKNVLIQELRAQMKNPYNIDRSEREVISDMGGDSFRKGIGEPENAINNQSPQNTAFNTQQNNTQQRSNITESPVVQNQQSETPVQSPNQQQQTTVSQSYQQQQRPSNERLGQQIQTNNPGQTYQQNNSGQPIQSDQQNQSPTLEQNPQQVSEQAPLRKESTDEVNNQQSDNSNSIDKDEVVGFFDVGLDDAFNIISGGNKKDDDQFIEKQREEFKRANIDNQDKNIPPTVSSNNDQTPTHQHSEQLTHATSTDRSQVKATEGMEDQPTGFYGQSKQSENNQNLIFSSVDPVVEMNDRSENKKDKPGKIGGLLGKVKDTLAP